MLFTFSIVGAFQWVSDHVRCDFVPDVKVTDPTYKTSFL